MRKPPSRHGLKAEINVVPYIDVMLVLLIIFMVTTPMLIQGVSIELPKVANEALPTDTEKTILTLTIKADGGYVWNVGQSLDTEHQTGSAASLEAMTSQVMSIVTAKGDIQVLLRADRSADYARVIAGISALQQGGVRNLGLITEPPQ